MVETVGELLREMRIGANLSLGKLAQRADISKMTLSRWEAGTRQPSVPELEATLTALNANAAARARVFSRIEAPRALRHLRKAESVSGLGPPPMLGDLLRAMRLRAARTQEEVARFVGVARHSVARWELGERLPAGEQLQQICYVLGASEEELATLTCGSFMPGSARLTQDSAEVVSADRSRLVSLSANTPVKALHDLAFLALATRAWALVASEKADTPLLAYVYCSYSIWLSMNYRVAEAKQYSNRVTALTPSGATIDPIFVFNTINDVSLSDSDKSPRVQGDLLTRLKRWLPYANQPISAAWMRSILAQRLLFLGEADSAIVLSQQACRIVERAGMPMEVFLRRQDVGELLISMGRPEEAVEYFHTEDLDFPARKAASYVSQSNAFLTAGKHSTAHDCLQKAITLCDAYHLVPVRKMADDLAKRF